MNKKMLFSVTRIAPGSTYRSSELKFLALDEDYSVLHKYSRFVPTKMNNCVLANGVLNVHTVSIR